eukprot:PLAT6721.1.p1 GENE.PLAT6721.1~~PLAT6721.1.p1  ORF type:complete len:423 (-),score=153.50 PLAT6721.1:149-1417(-)
MVKVVALFVATWLAVAVAAVSNAPQQVHLSIAGEGQLTVSWVTNSSVSQPQLQYGRSAEALDQTVGASYSTYTAGGWIGAIYNASTCGLEASSRMYYRVGDAATGLWSAIFSARLPAGSGGSQPLHFLMYADMGVEQSKETRAQVAAAAKASRSAFVLHSGDISYADGYVWKFDAFMRLQQPLAARLPVAYAVGNHEHHYNYTAYKSRFFASAAASGSASPFWYSFDVGPLHVTVLSSEHNYTRGSQQWNWFSADLAAAAAPAARAKTPWLLVTAHRPLYCSTDDYYDCHMNAKWMRDALEPLMKAAKVDLYLAGHLHNYERTLPVYNETVTSQDYNDPRGTVHAVVGCPGSDEGLTPGFTSPQPAWSAFRNGTHYCYASINIHNATAMTFDWVMTDVGDAGTVGDSFTIVKPAPEDSQPPW